MADHPDHPYSFSQRQAQQLHNQQQQQQQQQLHPTQQLHHHRSQQFQPHALQTQRLYHQDNQGPFSAGVIEDRRAFPIFRSSQPQQQQPQQRQQHQHTFLRQASISHGPTTATTTASRTLSIADILERYSASPEEFVITVLNAKAKEDERKAEEERYKTEKVKLQSRQLDLNLALEKRRRSPPIGRSYATSTADSTLAVQHAPSSTGNNFHQGYPTSAHPTSSSGQPIMTVDNNSTRSHYGGNGPQDTQEQSQQDQPDTPTSPPNRRTSLRINTAVRQGHSRQQQQHYQQQLQQQQQAQKHHQTLVMQQQHMIQPQIKQQAQHQQRQQPHSPHPHGSASMQGPGSRRASVSTSGRLHGFSTFLSSSAQSSPVTIVDMQSQIPQPLSPMDEYASPTSATPSGFSLKRKSINHDAVMDAVRAKVLRNAAAGQNQQREQPLRKPNSDSSGRRKAHPLNSSNNSSSPDRPKKPAQPAVSAAVAVTEGDAAASQRRVSNISISTVKTTTTTTAVADGQGRIVSPPGRPSTKQEESEGSLVSPHPLTRSPPASMSPPSSASRSNSSSPQMGPARYHHKNQYQPRSDHPSKPSDRDRERTRAEPNSYEEDEGRPRFGLDQSRAERPSEVGALAT
ncbi:hypothetical protein BGX29_005338 [Mortierella sp. GBA35]|nr:hypothetical protein BGX29_005338 [Mortierella sp. GBA35]